MVRRGKPSRRDENPYGPWWAPTCSPAASLALARIRRALAALAGDRPLNERQDWTAFSISVLELGAVSNGDQR